MRHITILVLIFLLWCTLIPESQTASIHAASNLPDGFFEDVPITGLRFPIAFDWTPDGRIFIGEREGTVRMIKNGTLSPDATIGLSVRTNGERGLGGLVVDPQFLDRPYIYLFYTPGPGSLNDPGFGANRISRFTLVGDTLDRSSERILVDRIPSSEKGVHNGGDLHFGPDGMLYASIGDGGYSERSQDVGRLTGKILRIDPDTGLGATDNPFIRPGDPHPDRDRVWAYGFRNPFRFSFDPASGMMYIGDVGSSKFEELNVGQRAANYGWDEVEGPNRVGNRSMTAPFFSYGHGIRDSRLEGCSSVIGGPFERGTNFPTSYNGDYFFADAVCNRIFRLQPGSTPTVSVFATNMGNPVHLAFSPDGMLYWSDFSGGKLRRIRYTASNAPPTAQATAHPLTGPLPLTVNFTSTSSDPDNDPIRYHWDFGDGSSSDEPNPVHTYTRLGPFEAVLTVSDTYGGRSSAAPIVIVPDNHAPEPRITAPTDGNTFHIGDQITLQGEATDQEDGMLSGENLRWEVVWHHGTSHTHPLAVGSGNTLTFPMRAPEDLVTASTSYAEATLIATDNAGTTSSTTIRLYPQVAKISVQTQPPGLRVVLDGEVHLTPVTVDSVKGWSFNVGGFFQTLGDCQGYTLDRWSIGVEGSSYTTPEGDAVLEATFRGTKAHCTFLPFVAQSPF